MRSKVAEELREEERRRVLEMTPDERVTLALSLGDEAIALYMSANGVTREVALQTLRRASSVGRTPSCANEP